MSLEVFGVFLLWQWANAGPLVQRHFLNSLFWGVKQLVLNPVNLGLALCWPMGFGYIVKSRDFIVGGYENMITDTPSLFDDFLLAAAFDFSSIDTLVQRGVYLALEGFFVNKILAERLSTLGA